MASHTTLGALFAAIANAIRAKTGGTEEIIADDFPTKIAEIETGADVSVVTASENDVRAGKIFVKADGTQANGAVAVQGEDSVVVDILENGNFYVNVPKGIYDSAITKEVAGETNAEDSVLTLGGTIKGDGEKTLVMTPNISAVGVTSLSGYAIENAAIIGLTTSYALPTNASKRAVQILSYGPSTANNFLQTKGATSSSDTSVDHTTNPNLAFEIGDTTIAVTVENGYFVTTGNYRYTLTLVKSE